MLSRRNFLTTSATLATLAPFRRARAFDTDAGHRIAANAVSRRLLDPDPHALAAAAVDAAKAAGAKYADVRLTETRSQMFFGNHPVFEEEGIAVGVRVLVDGYWGFMSSAVWTPDEVARLARGAVAQAKVNALGSPRTVDLGTIPRVENGHWVMPVKYDPFTIPIGEKIDFMQDAVASALAIMNATQPSYFMSFRRQRKVFASSESSSWEQTTYLTSANFAVAYRDQYSLGLNPASASADFMTPAGKGWEHISESGLVGQLPRLVDEAEQARHITPVEMNVYDTVFSAQSVAALADATIGAATELDRAMGYEANASGTSYLNDPAAMLGTYKVGAPLLNVTANRSVVGGAATVQWDDEAVVPDTFPLVTDGVVADFQTTREQAAWLASAYQKINRPIRSHGCAGSESAMKTAIQHMPNLRVVPGSADLGFEELVSGIKKGMAVLSLTPEMDQQQLNGTAYPLMREITNGKLGRFVAGGAIAFRAPELWKKMQAIGGATSERMYGFERTKAQPAQATTHSVSAVPARIADVRVFNARYRA